MTRCLTDKSISELDQSVVTCGGGALAYLPHVLAQSALAPVVTGCLFGARRLAGTRGFQQGSGRGGVIRRIVARREGVVAPRRDASGVFVDKCS